MGRLIQYVLIAGAVVVAIIFVRGQHGVRVQASKRLAFFAFLVLNVYAVLRPDDVTKVAHLVGVGRGTDLLLYAVIVAFVFTVLAFYLRLQEDEQRITQLSRAVALRDAEVLNRERGLLTPVATPFTAAATAPLGPAVVAD